MRVIIAAEIVKPIIRDDIQNSFVTQYIFVLKRLYSYRKPELCACDGCSIR